MKPKSTKNRPKSNKAKAKDAAAKAAAKAAVQSDLQAALARQGQGQQQQQQQQQPQQPRSPIQKLADSSNAIGAMKQALNVTTDYYITALGEAVQDGVKVEQALQAMSMQLQKANAEIVTLKVRNKELEDWLEEEEDDDEEADGEAATEPAGSDAVN